MKIYLLCFVLILTLILNGCETTSPLFENYEHTSATIDLQYLNAGEAEIGIHIVDSLRHTVIVMKNGVQHLEFDLYSKDTILVEKLSPDSQYIYQVRLFDHGRLNTISNEFSFTTKSASNQNFSWTYKDSKTGAWATDAAVINDNEYLVVGSLTPMLSLDYATMWVWKNNEWVRFYSGEGARSFDWPYSVLAFSSNNIWMASSHLIHFDGSDFQYYYFSADCCSKFYSTCGFDKNNIYLGGEKNSQRHFVHFYGSDFKAIDAPAKDLDFMSIEEDKNGNVWIVAYDREKQVNKSSIIVYNKESFNILYNQNDNTIFTSVWVDNENNIFLAKGNTIYKQMGTNSLNLREIASFSFPIIDISGNYNNDIIVCGERGIGHYNGVSTKEYLKENFHSFTGIKKVAIKNNTAVVCGDQGAFHPEDLVIVGKR